MKIYLDNNLGVTNVEQEELTQDTIGYNILKVYIPNAVLTPYDTFTCYYGALLQNGRKVGWFAMEARTSSDADYEENYTLYKATLEQCVVSVEGKVYIGCQVLLGNSGNATLIKKNTAVVQFNVRKSVAINNDILVLDPDQTNTDVLESYKNLLENALLTYVTKASIADDLTTNDSSKVLSAKQGKVLKDALDLLVANTYTKTESDNTFAPKATAITHTGNQLKDYSGNNIYPNLDDTTKLKIDLPVQNTTKYNHLETAGGNINASTRFLANYIIEKNTIITSIDMYVGSTAYASGTIFLEIWGLTETNVITKRFSTSVTNNNITGNINIPVRYITTESSYIIVYRVGTFLPQIVFNASEHNGVLFIRDIASTSLTLSSMSQYSGHLCLKANCVVLKNTQKLSNTIYVGANGDFATIQEAINNIVDDSVNNTYTIIVDKGTYSRFSMRSSVTGISRMRYISIIGIDKMQCKIYDDTGHYVTGSCDLWNYGSFENFTIEVNHNNDISEQNRKSYALHMDFGQCNTIIRNCIFKSKNGPAVGIGLYQDTTITFDDCDIYSDCPSDYTALLNYGALFCHGNTTSDVTNQLLNVYNCRIISENSDRGAWISNPGHNDVKVASVNSLYYTGNSDGVSVVLDEITVLPYSYGNSATKLNNL